MSSSGLLVDGMDVPVFVVDLDSRADRWDAVSRRISAQGLQAQRMSALTGSTASQLGYRTAIPQLEQAEWFMSPGAIGCAASHVEVYRRVAGWDAPGALVLEDDAVGASLAADCNRGQHSK